MWCNNIVRQSLSKWNQCINNFFTWCSLGLPFALVFVSFFLFFIEKNHNCLILNWSFYYFSEHKFQYLFTFYKLKLYISVQPPNICRNVSWLKICLKVYTLLTSFSCLMRFLALCQIFYINFGIMCTPPLCACLMSCQVLYLSTFQYFLI